MTALSPKPFFWCSEKTLSTDQSWLCSLPAVLCCPVPSHLIPSHPIPSQCCIAFVLYSLKRLAFTMSRMSSSEIWVSWEDYSCFPFQRDFLLLCLDTWALLVSMCSSFKSCKFSRSSKDKNDPRLLSLANFLFLFCRQFLKMGDLFLPFKEARRNVTLGLCLALATLLARDLIFIPGLPGVQHGTPSVWYCSFLLGKITFL